MAETQLKSFLALVQERGAQTTNMYELEINTGLKAVDDYLAYLTMMSDGFKAPGLGIKYEGLPFRGVPIQIPTNPEIDQDFSMKIWCDVSGKARQAFHLWQNSIIDMDFEAGSYLGGNRRPPQSSTIRLKLLKDDMKTVAEIVTLHGVSIGKVGEVQYTNDAGGIARFEVSGKFAWPSYEPVE
jgi:hypothetical protein